MRPAPDTMLKFRILQFYTKSGSVIVAIQAKIIFIRKTNGMVVQNTKSAFYCGNSKIKKNAGNND